MDPIVYNCLNTLANTILPEVVKILVELLVIPLLGLAARWFVQYLTQHHLSILVKWAGQKISRTQADWAKARLDLVVNAAQKVWWLKWVNKADLETYIEAAVSEWNSDMILKTGRKL